MIAKAYYSAITSIAIFLKTNCATISSNIMTRIITREYLYFFWSNFVWWRESNLCGGMYLLISARVNVLGRWLLTSCSSCWTLMTWTGFSWRGERSWGSCSLLRTWTRPCWGELRIWSSCSAVTTWIWICCCCWGTGAWTRDRCYQKDILLWMLYLFILVSLLRQLLLADFYFWVFVV